MSDASTYFGLEQKDQEASNEQVPDPSDDDVSTVMVSSRSTVNSSKWKYDQDEDRHQDPKLQKEQVINNHVP